MNNNRAAVVCRQIWDHRCLSKSAPAVVDMEVSHVLIRLKIRRLHRGKFDLFVYRTGQGCAEEYRALADIKHHSMSLTAGVNRASSR